MLLKHLGQEAIAGKSIIDKPLFRATSNAKYPRFSKVPNSTTIKEWGLHTAISDNVRDLRSSYFTPSSLVPHL